MAKESGVGENSRAHFGGSGAVRSLGDSFQPNLAMGGGSYKIPFDLPSGPGGLTPQMELVYNTATGNGMFGLGWSLSIPFIERRRPRAFKAEGEPEYSLGGAMPLVKTNAGEYVAEVAQQTQRFSFTSNFWHSRTLALVDLYFGISQDSRVEVTTDTLTRTQRWHIERMVFPGGREIYFEYMRNGNQLYPQTIRWSVFRLEFIYEDRPDPWSQFDSGFEIRTTKRCARIELHQDRLAETLMRVITFEYNIADYTSTSLLKRVNLSGQRQRNGVNETASLPPLSFSYTTFSPDTHFIKKFRSNVIPPPGLSTDVTLVDLGGTALPGAFRLDAQGGTYWENRGDLNWGPPQSLRYLPAGLALSDPGVRFADMEGRGNADLVVGRDQGGGYYPNRPGIGFIRKQNVTLAPSFDISEEDSLLIDLDGDRVSDILTFRNGVPIAFLNQSGKSWTGPWVLSNSGLPNLSGLKRRVRLADMNGDGQADVVLLQSNAITYWPYLGNGKWEAPRTMDDSPDFSGAELESDVFIADINGTGAADLILLTNSEIRVYINRAGERYSEPIVFTRTPRAGFDHVLLADMTGSGTVGLLFTSPAGQGGHVQYWFLDLLNGVKPHLLNSIDNGSGLITEVEYSTSAFERTRDLNEGRRWSGYLPFVVPVVKRLRINDRVSGEISVSDFRYHDGHFDGNAREYLGFAEVESLRSNGTQEQPIKQRLYFHTRNTTARDPAFIAGRGQPHRTETIDPYNDNVLQLEESQWTAITIEGTPEDSPAYLAVEKQRRSERRYMGIAYESEQVDYMFDVVGNILNETRRSIWRNNDDIEQLDVLQIQKTYAKHPISGLTNFIARQRKLDGSGALLKEVRFHYDGDAFVGLPLGEVKNGFRVRQTEVALTQREIVMAYNSMPPSLLTSLYRTEMDPEFGQIYVHDVGRARVDMFGNELETIDANGMIRHFTMDAESIHPVKYSEDGGPDHDISFDPISQQLARFQDLNGNLTITDYDGLGNAVSVYKRGALPGKPTEEYEYHRDVVPNMTIQRIRINAEDTTAGYQKIEYFDGCGRSIQTKLLTEDGRWAVGKQELKSIQGKRLKVRDAYFSTTQDYEDLPPIGVISSETHYDVLGRVVRERLFNGEWTLHRYIRNRVEFFNPDDMKSLADDADALPTRESLLNAQGQVCAIIERDGEKHYTQRRDYDVLRRLIRLVDPLGDISLENVYDLWGNRIRIRSCDAGTTTFVYNSGCYEVQRTDADGRILLSSRDVRGRITELRDGNTNALLETYDYDTGSGTNLQGRLVKVSGDFGNVEYSYSAQGQATSITRIVKGITGKFITKFEYNNQRQVTAVVYPDNSRVNYQHSVNGMLQAIPGYIEAIEYGPTGLRSRIQFANGLESKRTYTPGDYLINELITQQSDGYRYQHLVYELDAVGQVQRIDDLSTVPGKIRLNQIYTYNARNHLTHVSSNVNGFDFDYEYDALGNMLRNDEINTLFEYRNSLGDSLAPNRLVRRLSSTTPEFDYDASGNMTRDPEIGRLHYDSRHRLIHIDRNDGSMVDYVYDHNDRRLLSRTTTNGISHTRIEIEGLYMIDDDIATRIVFDENRRLAIVPSNGDAMIHHFDRLGNVNVMSNGRSGAFVGHDEYTPYGRLFVSIVIQPAYTFQGGHFTDGLELLLLGVRHYRPSLGRFLTSDPYLLSNQEKIPPLLTAANFYVYAYCNPTNFTDPTGEIAPLVIAIIVAAIVGAIIGTIGAAVNGANTWDEWLLWIIGGAIGAVLTVLFWYGILVWAGVAAATAAIAASIITLGASVLGLFTPLMDESDSGVAWAFSWAIKLIKSPIFTIIGLFVVIGFALDGKRVDFRRGALFVETGAGNGALTLGAIVYTQSGLFDSSDHVRDDVARHEAYHTRAVAALGEWGFYFTYITFGSIFAAATGGPWNGLNTSGCGNPFEKHAYTYFNHWTGGPNPMEISASQC